MGNAEARPGDKLPPNSGKFVWQDQPVKKLCPLKEEKELQALRNLPALKPVNSDVANANFVTRARAVAPEAMDVRPIMLLIWDYNAHVKEQCERASNAQEHTLKLLTENEKTIAQCLQTMNTHANTISALTSSFGELQAVSGMVRDTVVRAQYAEEAAERFERVMALVESEIEVKFPHVLETMPDIPEPPSDDSIFNMPQPQSLAMPLGMM